MEPNTQNAKTIFLTVNSGVNVRNILRGNVLATLRRSGHRIVILSPTWNDPSFRKEFSGERVAIEPLHVHKPGWLERKLNMLRFTLFPDLCDTLRIVYQPTVERSALKNTIVHVALAAVRVVGQTRAARALRWISAVLFADRYHGELFRRYKPDVVCVTEVFNFAPDVWILRRARREGVPTVFLVRSWDNLTTKGVFPAWPDKLVVWSDTMKREAMELHGFRDEDVFVGGVPHFDFYTDVANLPSREEFFRRIGADPSKKLITYALVPPTRVPNEMQVVEDLWKAMQQGELAFPSQLLVRLYPVRNVEVPAHLRNQPGLVFDLPPGHQTFSDSDMSIADLRHLVATMRYSDVVLNMASTISVDAAAVDTPVVCVAFDGREPQPYHRSVLMHYDLTHFKRLVPLGGFRRANTLQELVAHINAYLRDPSLDRAGRRRIVESECQTLDGRAGERVANYVLDQIERHSEMLREKGALATGQSAQRV